MDYFANQIFVKREKPHLQILKKLLEQEVEGEEEVSAIQKPCYLEK